MQSIKFLLQRLAAALILVLAVIVLNFLLIHFAPGDPVETLAGAMGGMTEELRTQLRHAYGLDQSLLHQLGVYLSHFASGDLGHSYYFNLPVTDLILQRVPATLLLVITSLVFSLVVGTLLGVLASRRPNGLLSQAINVISLVGYAAPVFWTGIILVILFASVFPIFPTSGMQAAVQDGGVMAHALDVAHHLVLPALTLGIIYLAQFSRMARASMLDVLGSDFVRTARSKGLSETTVFYKHALRNALLPIITITGLHFGNLFAGAILVETVFNWPGLGRLAFESILRRDTPTILGILFLSACMVVLANQLTDVCYRIADPRIKR
ncbi:ABC transporter permease [Noviherbaspirillum soli]|uniref:ABC transporter permease n=1 Tax=Noviherbaspirillum soli TaxID=1064518 RepID=UPI00188B372A|nr:ABC transporter permease [Noviherbaspirillum soli]